MRSLHMEMYQLVRAICCVRGTRAGIKYQWSPYGKSHKCVSAPKPSISETQRVDKSDTSSRDHEKKPLACLDQLHQDHWKIFPVELRNLRRYMVRRRNHQDRQLSQSHLVQQKENKSGFQVTYKKGVKEAKYATSYAYRKNIKNRPSG